MGLSVPVINRYRSLWNSSMETMLLYYRALVWYSWLEPIAEIPDELDVPTLILFGKRDSFVPIQNPTVTFHNYVSSRVKAASRIQFVDCGHWITHEQPDLVNEEIYNFINFWTGERYLVLHVFVTKLNDLQSVLFTEFEEKLGGSSIDKNLRSITCLLFPTLCFATAMIGNNSILWIGLCIVCTLHPPNPLCKNHYYCSSHWMAAWATTWEQFWDVNLNTSGSLTPFEQ